MQRIKFFNYILAFKFLFNYVGYIKAQNDVLFKCPRR
jgi:hypothetical protein